MSPLMRSRQIFPLYSLPVDIALEIIRIACSPSFSESFIATAAALSRVSYPLYKAAMPHLLRAVSLSSSQQLSAFLHSVQLQHRHRERNSRLSLDYKTFMKILWVSECWEPLVESSLDYTVDYHALSDIMGNAEEIALNDTTLHLLYNGLSLTSPNSSARWKCRKLIISGTGCRWNPLISTRESQSFLSQLTHLTILVPLEARHVSAIEETLNDPETNGILPHSLAGLAPIRYMPELRQLSFCVSRPYPSCGTIVTYASRIDSDPCIKKCFVASSVQDIVFPSTI